MAHEFWYLSRAAGFTAYGLLFVSVALGIMIGTRLMGRVPRGAMFDLHRFTSILAVAFTAFHALILLGDGYFRFNLLDLLVPFVSPYRPWQTAAGVTAFWIAVVVAASFYVRQHIGYRTWRALHFLTFALFGLALLHGITAGTDTGAAWGQLIYAGTAIATLVLVIYRVQHRFPQQGVARGMRFAGAAAATVAIAAILFSAALRTSSDDRSAGSAASAQAAAAAGARTSRLAAAPAAPAPAVEEAAGAWDEDEAWDDDEHEDDDDDDDDDEDEGWDNEYEEEHEDGQQDDEDD